MGSKLLVIRNVWIKSKFISLNYNLSFAKHANCDGIHLTMMSAEKASNIA